MKRANAAMFFQHKTSVAKAGALALSLLLIGCSHAVKKPVPAPATAVTTGIPECDSYLATYVACHRTAGIYPTDTLQAHYQVMRDTLLQEAGDPHARPFLANRCRGLAQQLQDTLQGRTCAMQSTATASSAH